MARCLIIGCGCRGQTLARALVERGHPVRATTRDAGRRLEIEAAGAECVVADPDRLGTLVGALEHVTVAVLLLASAQGESEALAALHGPRLDALLTRMVDSTVRGVVYETRGSVAIRLLSAGAAAVRGFSERTRCPVALLDSDPARHEDWLPAALAAVEEVLVVDRGRPTGRFVKVDLYSTKSRSGFIGGRAVADYAKDVLVEPEWLEEHLNDDSIRIVEVDENPALYREAHIPCAIGFDWKTDLQDQVKRDFLEPEEFGRLFGSRGISNDHQIILYGDRNNWFAAYTYWYLKYYGHDNVKLLNGPRERWISEGRPTTTDVPSYPEVTFNAQAGDEAIRARRDEVLQALGDSTELVDVRSPQEFSGELISPVGYEQEGAQRGGHIPGAKSVPWAQAVRDDGTFKSADELRELYGGKDVLSGDPIIAYCRIGERSAHTWFVLHELLGEQDVKNYDGSWTEWGNMVNVPIEKG